MTRDERLARLERQVADLTDRLTLFAEGTAETNLRVLFLLHNVRFMRKKPGGLVGVDGQEPVEIQTAAQRYDREREDFLRLMSAETRKVIDALQAEHATDGPTGEGAADDESAFESIVHSRPTGPALVTG